MTFEEMEKSLKGPVAQIKHIEDAQVVQGVLERRSEDRIDSLADRIDSLAAAAEATNSAAEKLLQVVTVHEQRLVGVEDRTAAMEAAMKALFEQMDRFIRGLGSDGHKWTPEQ
jgi:ABC-type hemin transport system substrate-binding protein